jgi:hypothetical protein
VSRRDVQSLSGKPPACTLAFRHILHAPFVSGRADQRKMRRNGHRHTLARLSWRKATGAFTIRLPGVVGVTLVSLAFGDSRGHPRVETADQASKEQPTVPSGLATDRGGDPYAADSDDSKVRENSPSGIITRIAGDGSRCSDLLHCGDGGPAMEAQLVFSTGITINAAGDLFIAESGDLEIQEVTPAGTIIRLARDDSTCLAYLPVAGNCGDREDARCAHCVDACSEAGPTSSVTQDADVLVVTLARMTVTDLNRLDSN